MSANKNASPVLLKLLKRINPMALISFVAATLFLVLALLYLHSGFANWYQQYNKEHLQTSARWVSQEIATTLELKQQALAQAAQQADVRQVFIHSQTNRELAIAAVKSRLPDATTVRLLFPQDLAELEVDEHDRGYAALDMLLQARHSSSAPPAELHWFGTANERINLVEPVVENDNLVGLLEVTLPARVLTDLFRDLNVSGGHITLRQLTPTRGSSVMVFKQGRLSGTSEESIPVSGTQFLVGYAAEPGFKMVQTQSVSQGFITGGIFILLALIAVKIRSIVGAVSGRIGGHSKADPNEPMLADIVKSQQPEKSELDPKIRRKIEEAEGEMARQGGGEFAAAQDIDPSIFRAYDIRGIVDTALTPAVVRSIGRAIGSEAIDRGVEEVVVARDGRLSGPDLAEALSEGLQAAGVDVIDIGMVPTPVLYFATHHLETGSGVMVTGSHNPPEYNGLKIMLDGDTLSGDAIKGLYQRIANNDLRSGSGGIQERDVVDDYIDTIASDVQLEDSLKVVVDAGNGVAGAIAPELLAEIGAEVEPLFCEVDGNFPNHHPDPSVPENLKDLATAVARLDADIGLAFDGDGDRLGVITRNGDMIYPDRILMLFAKDVLARQPGAPIIYDVKCTGHLSSEILRHGGSPIMWKTGHSFIKGKMKEADAELAGEMSGHFFFKERWYGFDDGLYAACRLLEILAADGRDAEEIFAELPEGVSTPEIKIEMAEGEHYAFMEKFQEQAKFDKARLTTIDGVRADFPDGWGLVRCSNTTPCLVLRFDADDEDALARIIQIFKTQIKSVDSSINTDF